MKIQTLNKKQQEKLLFLCEEFFPDYKCAIGFDVDQQICLEKGKNETWIHWYQLCLTELPERIWKQLDWKGYHDLNDKWWKTRMVYQFQTFLFEDIKGDCLNDFKFTNFNSKHPVDYLWDIVQKCKKNKYFKS